MISSSEVTHDLLKMFVDVARDRYVLGTIENLKGVVQRPCTPDTVVEEDKGVQVHVEKDGASLVAW